MGHVFFFLMADSHQPTITLSKEDEKALRKANKVIKKAEKKIAELEKGKKARKKRIRELQQENGDLHDELEELEAADELNELTIKKLQKKIERMQRKMDRLVTAALESPSNWEAAALVGGVAAGFTFVGYAIGVGVANAWNPVGWAMLGVAGVGGVIWGALYFARVSKRKARLEAAQRIRTLISNDDGVELDDVEVPLLDSDE